MRMVQKDVDNPGIKKIIVIDLDKDEDLGTEIVIADGHSDRCSFKWIEW